MLCHRTSAISEDFSMTIRFDNRVAIVTGGGNGLGRQHCLQLAGRGAKVVVNDLGGAVDGTGGSVSAAQAVADAIKAKGGEAIASGADITKVDQVEAMVAEAKAKWGRVDILINNAGILRDKTFAKMTMEDFKKVVDVHLFGTANCTKAVWETMREQNYGRIVMTSSSSGIYGNFGQSNYGAAKAAMVGFMNVLALEGAKNNIKVNTLSPTAATRMVEGLVPEAVGKLMGPELVSPGVLFLVSENAPTKTILGAGAGSFSVVHIYETQPVFIGGASATVDDFAANWAKISDPKGEEALEAAFAQTNRFVAAAAQALGVKLS
jgi:NAD(P)-dependent dehydrogenase (short-subunit alcohol dehydrogenase family)